MFSQLSHVSRNGGEPRRISHRFRCRASETNCRKLRLVWALNLFSVQGGWGLRFRFLSSFQHHHHSQQPSNSVRNTSSTTTNSNPALGVSPIYLSSSPLSILQSLIDRSGHLGLQLKEASACAQHAQKRSMIIPQLPNILHPAL